MDPTGQRGILQPLPAVLSRLLRCSKNRSSYSAVTGLHSHVRSALTHVLLFLQPVEELRETALSILKDAGQNLEGNLNTVGLAGAWAGGGSLAFPARKQHSLQSVPAPRVPLDECCESLES